VKKTASPEYSTVCLPSLQRSYRLLWSVEAPSIPHEIFGTV